MLPCKVRTAPAAEHAAGRCPRPLLHREEGHGTGLGSYLRTAGNRKWYRVEMEGVRHFDRPDSQGGAWALASRIKVIGNDELEES